MNCDDFLAARETGGPFARMRARRHAARCRRCTALQAKFAAVKDELANAPALPARARQLWVDAAIEPASQISPRRNWALFTGGLAAAACVALLVIKLAGHKPAGVTPPPQIVRVIPPVATESKVTVVDPAKDLAELSAAANQLDAELKQLRLEAERMDARRQVALTLEHYDKW
jgi:hypothetical protein